MNSNSRCYSTRELQHPAATGRQYWAVTLTIGHWRCTLKDWSARTKDHRSTHSFEARWLFEEECSTVVKNDWQAATISGHNSIHDTLRYVAGELKNWDQNVLGDIEKRIKILKKELEACRRKQIAQNCINREHVLRGKIDRLEEQRDMYWRQRSYIQWLQKGDRNAKFFHAFASERKRTNTIKRLKCDDGSWVEGKSFLFDMWLITPSVSQCKSF